MTTTTVGIFGNLTKAEDAIGDVLKLGVKDTDISYDHDSSIKTVTVKSTQPDEVREIFKKHDAEEIKDFNLE